ALPMAQTLPRRSIRGDGAHSPVARARAPAEGARLRGVRGRRALARPPRSLDRLGAPLEPARGGARRRLGRLDARLARPLVPRTPRPTRREGPRRLRPVLRDRL